jgi:hypothetical protein
MMNFWKILRDEHVDDALVLIRKLNAASGWSKEAKLHQHQLRELLESKVFINFWSSSSRYLVSKIGESYLYDVPMYKRGLLSKFRGKRVRVVCISSGSHADREYMAGVVGDTPSDKIVRSQSEEYSFPDVGKHKVVYSSPRFKVIEVNDDTQISSSYEPDGFIDYETCDLVLIDGAKCIPIAKLKHVDNGRLEGVIVGSNYWRRYLSLNEAISHLSSTSDAYHKPTS